MTAKSETAKADALLDEIIPALVAPQTPTRLLDRLGARVDSHTIGGLVEALRMSSRDDLDGVLATLTNTEQPESVRRWGPTYWQTRLEELLPQHTAAELDAACRRAFSLPRNWKP